MPMISKHRELIGYTTSDIAKLGIKRERNKAWEKSGHISGPSIKDAEGPGSPGLYNKDDLYKRAILQYLTQKGYTTPDAGELVEGLELLGRHYDAMAYVAFYEIEENEVRPPRWIDAENIEELLEGLGELKKMKVCVIINVEDIRNKVDGLIDPLAL